ncbi:hypothetical protein HDV00_000758 [Rhizophlyctis rosea]|nr:hypothetical protein HDV00_000758 [Rhizophlyctis rosea]
MYCRSSECHELERKRERDLETPSKATKKTKPAQPTTTSSFTTTASTSPNPSTTQPASASASGSGTGTASTCSRPGHCVGDTCQYDDECSNSLKCVSGECGVSPSTSATLAASASGFGTGTASTCSWPGHCVGDICQYDDECSNSLKCVSGKDDSYCSGVCFGSPGECTPGLRNNLPAYLLPSVGSSDGGAGITPMPQPTTQAPVVTKATSTYSVGVPATGATKSAPTATTVIQSTTSSLSSTSITSDSTSSAASAGSAIVASEASSSPDSHKASKSISWASHQASKSASSGSHEASESTSSASKKASKSATSAMKGAARAAEMSASESYASLSKSLRDCNRNHHVVSPRRVRRQGSLPSDGEGKAGGKVHAKEPLERPPLLGTLVTCVRILGVLLGWLKRGTF